MTPSKFPQCDWLYVTPCTIEVEQEGLSEDGEPLTAFTWVGKCRHSQKASEVLTGDRKLVTLCGAVQVKGDIAPDISVFAGGCVTVGGAKYRIYRGHRPHNPDGTVHHTTLELI